MLSLLAFLWFRLIDQLRIEWWVNPQYTYGWAVPFLCAYLLWKRLHDHSALRTPHSAFAGEETFQSFSVSAFQLFAISALLLYLPTRLIQEANPEWRLVSWALALEVIAITLFLLPPIIDGLGLTQHATRNTQHATSQHFNISAFQHFSISAFPFLFFLVAVPWPTFIEAPVIQGLTRANTATTVELLGLLGIPALQHGNVIEVGTGVVGIDEACSGIRSFQATLMIGLFFGELYRLTALRRLSLCLAGFTLSFLFNLGRTTLLTWVAAHKGTAAIATWHDPAGVTILLACFISLWLIAKCEVRSAECGVRRSEAKVQSPNLQFQISNFKFQSPRSEVRDSTVPQVAAPSPVSALQLFSVSAFLLTWIALSELATETWYRWHERHLPPPVTWNIQLPADNPTLRTVPISEKTRRFLRYDEATDAAWEADGRRWQAIFLRWQPGRTAVHLAKGHTPEVCLSAAGNELIAQTDLCIVPCRGLNLPCRFYTFKTDTGPLHVVYCLWRDRAANQSFDTRSLTYQNRLAPVLAGTRLTGERSLELALWGCADDVEARTALESQLARLVSR